MIDRDQRGVILKLLRPFKPRRIGVFGSYTRGENTESSDLDLLVDFYARINLYDFIGLEQELSTAPGIKVDMVTEKSLDPLIRDQLEKEPMPLLYEE